MFKSLALACCATVATSTYIPLTSFANSGFLQNDWPSYDAPLTFKADLVFWTEGAKGLESFHNTRGI